MSLNPTVLNLPNDSLPILHPGLIDWDLINPNEMPMFPNDNSLDLYLNVVEPFSTNKIYQG